MGNTIHVTMLGKFTLWEEGMAKPCEVSLTGRSRRLWILVAYLILHRDRGVPAQELIDLLWPDASSGNPVSTLQNNASRARSALTDSGFSDARRLVACEDGLYRWAPDRETELDSDIFERLARQALAKRRPRMASLPHWKRCRCITGTSCRRVLQSSGAAASAPITVLCTSACAVRRYPG